jgi:hypothetical protein
MLPVQFSPQEAFQKAKNLGDFMRFPLDSAPGHPLALFGCWPWGRVPFPPRKHMTHRINEIIIIMIMRTKHDDNSYTSYE